MCKSYVYQSKMIEKPIVNLDQQAVIKELKPVENCKYLGTRDADGIKHSVMREKIRNDCYRRIRAILKAELDTGNRIKAINTLVIPVVTYSFKIIN